MSIYDGVIIEDDVFIGPSVVFTNVKFPKSSSPVNKNYDKTLVKKSASIEQIQQLYGIVRKKSVCYAGSVVTKNLEEKFLILRQSSTIY